MTLSVPDKAKANARRYVELCYPAVQSHTELHKKTSSMCERWDGHLERALRKTV